MVGYHQHAQAYLAKIRSLKFNLAKPDNPDLRRDVLKGLIGAERLVSMTAEEMAPGKVWRDRGLCQLERVLPRLLACTQS